MGSGFNRDFNWRISVGVNIELAGCACGSGGAAAAVGPVLCCFCVVVVL